MQFLFVSSGFCLQLPSDSASRRTPLPLANSSYCQACSGLSPPSYSPCRAHLKKLLEQYAQEAFSSLDFNQLYPYLRSINRISDDERMHCHTIHDDAWPNIRFVPNHKITYKNSSLR